MTPKEIALSRKAAARSPLTFLLFAMWMMSDARGVAEISLLPMTGTKVIDGTSPHIVIAGLKPGEEVTIHSFRSATQYKQGSDTGVPVVAHAVAIFTVDPAGRIDVDAEAPGRGTYKGVDALGLLWSGTAMDANGDASEDVTQNLNLKDKRQVVFRIKAASRPWMETRVQLVDGADLVDLQEVSQPGLNGVFARPKEKSSRPLPTIILLHGSEGGSTASARSTAIRFAQLGYAAFALNYFAWPGTGVTGVPQALVDIPVEELATVREWLMQQPGVDAQKVAIWGVSKGAEFALVAASHFDWVDRVVACVPSSVVWSGFGRPPAAGEVYSSWSIGNVGLPYIPYDHYEDALENRFSSAFVHQRSLDKATPQQRDAARIPIEKTNAKLLLLAAQKDVVWPSAEMSRQIEASLKKAGKADTIHLVVYKDASHYICGTGSETRRINPVHKPEGDDPTPEADAYATENSWKETRDFLKR